MTVFVSENFAIAQIPKAEVFARASTISELEVAVREHRASCDVCLAFKADALTFRIAFAADGRTVEVSLSDMTPENEAWCRRYAPILEEAKADAFTRVRRFTDTPEGRDRILRLIATVFVRFLGDRFPDGWPKFSATVGP